MTQVKNLPTDRRSISEVGEKRKAHQTHRATKPTLAPKAAASPQPPAAGGCSHTPRARSDTDANFHAQFGYRSAAHASGRFGG